MVVEQPVVTRLLLFSSGPWRLANYNSFNGHCHLYAFQLRTMPRQQINKDSPLFSMANCCHILEPIYLPIQLTK